MKKYTLLILLSLALISCSSDKVEKKVEVAKAVKSIIIGDAPKKSTFSFPGKILAGEEANMTFEVSGKIIELSVKEGQVIKKNDIIAKLDQKDFHFAYNKQLATYNEYKASFNRASELIKSKSISQSEFDKQKKSFEVAKADLNISKTNLDYTTLRAPFDGEIAQIYVDSFQNIKAQEDIAFIQNLDFLEVKINVPERLVIRKTEVANMDISVQIDADKTKSYKAKIAEVATRADEATQTYQVTLRFPKPEKLNILPGMTAIVKIVAILTKSTSDDFIIPADAIFSNENKDTFVWVINSKNRLIKTAIKTREFKNNDVVVDSGLKVGDIVVTAGVNFLREDQLVTDYK